MGDFRIFYQSADGQPGGEFLACSWCGEPFQLEWQSIFSFVTSDTETVLGLGKAKVCFDLCDQCAMELRTDIDTFFSTVEEEAEEDEGG